MFAAVAGDDLLLLILFTIATADIKLLLLIFLKLLLFIDVAAAAAVDLPQAATVDYPQTKLGC